MEETKIVYNINDASVLELNSSDKCPISGEWLIPSRYTDVEPPKPEDGIKYMFNYNNGEWEPFEVPTDEDIDEDIPEPSISDRIKSVEDEIKELAGRLEMLKSSWKKIREEFDEFITRENMEAFISDEE